MIPLNQRLRVPPTPSTHRPLWVPHASGFTGKEGSCCAGRGDGMLTAWEETGFRFHLGGKEE